MAAWWGGVATQEQGPQPLGQGAVKRKADLRAESTWHFLGLPMCLLQGRTGLRGLLLLERVGSTDVCGHRHLDGCWAREGGRTVQCQEEPLPAPLGCPPHHPAPGSCPPPSPGGSFLLWTLLSSDRSSCASQPGSGGQEEV